MTLAIAAKAKQMKKQGLDVISFSVGEPDFNTPINIIEYAKQAMDEGFTKYPPAAGIPELRQAVTKEFLKRGLEYSASQIVVSNGAKHSLYNALRALINEGDEVILPMPYWLSYPELIKLAGGTPKYLEPEDDFLITAESLSNSVTKKTKALIINNPSNPTGTVYTSEQLKKIAEVCVKNDIFVISDEIYDYLIYEDSKPKSIASFDGMADRTVVVNGASKTFAMTGWRIGWAAAPQKIADAMSAFQSHATGGANSIAQYAICKALEDERTWEAYDFMYSEFSKRRKTLMGEIEKINEINFIEPKGAFYLMTDISYAYGKKYENKNITNSLDFCETLLEAKNVAAVPGAAFGADNYIRLSYATSEENIKKGTSRLKEFIKELA